MRREAAGNFLIEADLQCLPADPQVAAAPCCHPCRRFPLLAMRGICGFASLALWYLSLNLLPLSDVNALSFISAVGSHAQGCSIVVDRCCAAGCIRTSAAL